MVGLESALEDVIGIFSTFRSIVARLIRVLRKEARRKDARAKTASALGALVDLQDALEELSKYMLEVADIVREVKIPVGLNAQLKIYDLVVKWVNSAADMVHALASVVDQAENLTHIKTLMKDLEELDAPLYEFVQLLVRSNRKEGIDFRELPTFAAVYLTDERQKSDLEFGEKEVIEEYVEKATNVAKDLSPPFRDRKVRLDRAFKRLLAAGDRLAPLPESTIKDLQRNTTRWAGISLDVFDAGISVGLDVSPRRSMRELPPPPPFRGISKEWTRGSHHNRKRS